MARSARRSKKSNIITVNFKGVEARGVVIPEGVYPAKVAEVTQEEGKEYPYLKWEFELTDGEFEGRKVFTNTSLSPQALWNLRTLLETLGVEIPDDEYDIDTTELVGAELNVVVEHEDYEGRPRARVADYTAIGSSGDESEEDDEDEKPRSKKAKKPAREEVEEDEEAEDEPKAKSRKSRRSRDVEEEEEDEPAPRGKKSSKKAKKQLSADDIEDMDEDALGEVVEEYGLDVDLDSARTMSKKRNLVLDALEEAGSLAEAA